MSKGRLEAFSDGVIAIIITIMVLELTVPHEPTVEALLGLWPVFISYVLSFVNVGIYWNNHHHLLQAASAIDGRVLWANLFLLFWLSLFPFATAFMGENDFAPVPVAVYGFVALCAGFAYYILARVLVRAQPKGSLLHTVVEGEKRGWISLVVFATAIPIALFFPQVAFAMYVLVALIWFVPDRRIERTLNT